MKEFERAYKQLNDEQKMAVDKIDGPVLVIAGPGTGKTELLSMRVSKILESTDTKPANILCLTFTNKAAVNMKERVIEQVGSDGAKVAISTFHSFAAEIMSLYPDFFWNAASLSVAPESVQLDIIESIVGQLPLDNPLALKFAGQYTLLNDIQRSINLTKEAGLTPDKLRAIINVNIAYIDEVEPKMIDILNQRLSAKNLNLFQEKVKSLPKQGIDQNIYPLTSLSTVIIDSLTDAVKQDEDSGKSVYTSRWKSRWIQTVDNQRGLFKERQRNAWWLALADVYQSYRDALHQRGFYDYADMLVETISQLEQNPQILADVQERFSYVLIDEFQDTTPAQLRLAHLVADHHTSEGKPNLMAVGDDDQSIFKFNGAELNNMLGFKRAYPAAKIITLTKNYRSSQNILDTAKKIIEQAESRLVNSDRSLSKNLTAEAPPRDKGEIKTVAYSSRELQFSEIARNVKRNYRPEKQIAVLARGHDSLIKIAGILQELKVPVRYEQASNILEHEIVNQVYLVMKLLLAIQAGDKTAANALVSQIICWPAWGIEPKALWLLATANFPNRNWLDSMLGSRFPKLKAIGEWFIWLAREADNQPLAVTIEQVLGLRKSAGFTSPIKAYYIDYTEKDTNKYFHGLSAIQLLRALIYEFGKASEPTVEELVRFVEINKHNKVIVADESPFISGRHAVQLLSVHKAKGLEFDHIYIVDAIEDNWQPRKGSRKPPANLPLQPVGDDLDDYVRLMYVAATRPRSSLTVSAYFQDHSGKEVIISPIIQTALPVTKINQDSRQKLIEVLEENLRWPELSGGQEREMLKDRLETYSLSVTHLLNFLDLTKGGPWYFKERNLLHLPEAKSAHLSYGTAIHRALDTAQKLTNKDGLSLERVKDVFAKALADEQLPKSEYKRYRTQGKRTLSRLFNDIKYQLPKGSSSEQNFKDITLAGARISGKLDRVDNQDGNLTVIDYKTGAPLASFDSSDKNKALKAYKHRLQLVFYALLMSERVGGDPKGKIGGQMVYVEAENAKALIRSYLPTKEDIERMRRLVEAVWSKIINVNLPNVSAYTKDLEGIKKFEDDLIAGKIH